MWYVIIFLILFGFLLLFLEFFVLPGFVAGILGGISVIAGIYQAYKVYGVQAGHITLGVTFFSFVGLMFFFLKSKTWKKIALNDAIDSRINEIKETIEVGDVGITISKLAPAGKGLIQGEVVEIHSTGELIEKNVKIKVVKIEGYKIYVEPIKEE